jgi:hypothetical protein
MFTLALAYSPVGREPSHVTSRASYLFDRRKETMMTWNPTIGEECLAGPNNLLVVPLCIDPFDDRWVCRTVTGGDYVGCNPTSLHPLPTDPPDTLYAKMKTRLEKLRIEAARKTDTRASVYMTELLADLEAYTKENK